MVSYRYTSCKACGACEANCPEKAITRDEEGVHIDRALCTRCGKCVDVCMYDAMRWTGEKISVDKVMKTVLRDKLYYQNSGGGVTCSGGEILGQADFVSEIFRRCHEEGIHTNADTCGYGSEESLRKIMSHADLTYFDLKLMDPALHAEYTGVENEVILRNLKITLEMGVPVVIRVPLIPEHNATEENLRALGSFVQSLGEGIREVCFLPYHSYGSNKYRMIDKTYPLEGLRKLTPEEEQMAVDIMAEFGITAKVSK